MKKILIYTGGIGTREALHDLLAEKLSLPEYYGRNLDALHDCLTDIREDTVIGLFEGKKQQLIDGYIRLLKNVLRDAEEENSHLSVVFGTWEDNLPCG